MGIIAGLWCEAMLFYSARRKLPAVDYVSIVRSLYADPLSMIYGTLCGAVGAGISALVSGSVPLYLISILFVVFGIARYFDMWAFARDKLGAEDVERAQVWEVRNTIGGVIFAALHGFWCFFSLAVFDFGFAAFSSGMVTIAATVGIVARNFALDRLVTLQALFVAVPFAAGLFMKGDPAHYALATLLLIFMLGLRRMAAGLRENLLGAVHGRVEARRLATELDTALTTMPHGLCMLDESGKVSVVNRRAAEIFPALAPQRSVGRDLPQIIASARREGLISFTLGRQLLQAVALGASQRKHVVALPAQVWCEVTVHSLRGRTVLMFEDITERVRANERINFMARFDGLTSLPNRNHFSDEVEADLARKRLTKSRESVMLMMIDIDDFKHVNDTFGHLVGDALLVEAALRIQGVIGAGAMPSRFGGDEFTVYRSQGVNRRSVEREAEAVLDALGAPFLIMGHVIKAHASVGVVVARPTDDLATLLTRADLALYRAKGNGKAQWSLFHDVMDIDYRQRQRLKTDLREALDRDELFLVYQPIVDIRDRRVIGCEALARWHHKELGRIPPTVFIPIAEEIGAISDLSRWVLATATRECQQWPDPLKVSINLSATDFRTTDVAAMVKNGLDQSGLKPERLEVEITESTLIEEKQAVITALSELRRFGIGIALDDFGTGYSSLSYLHTLPFTKLKIDRSFVVDVTSSARSLTLLANIGRLSKDLDMTVTVEGIETEEQLTAVLSTGNVDQAQGYLFGVPLPQREIAELVEHVVVKAGSPRRAAAGKSR